MPWAPASPCRLWPDAEVRASEQIRVLHVAEVFGSGVFQVVRTIAERHAAQGHAVAIAFGCRRPETPDDPRALIDDSVELHALDWRRSSPLSHMRAARRLRHIVRMFMPDVVHLHSSFAGVIGAFALAGRVPLVYTPHAFASRIAGRKSGRLAFAAAERWTISRSDLVGAVSRSEAAEAASLGATRVVTVPNGIAELDEPLPITGERTRGRAIVAAGGRLVEQRRPADCARILSAVADEAEVIWIGGGGRGDAPEAGTALEASGVRVTGWLPHEAAIEMLGSASAYLHWTAWDGSPLSVLEAMARDVVVVASDIPPNRELLGFEQVCRDEAEAVVLIRRVLRDGDFSRRLLATQRQRRGAHSANAMVARWLDVYRQVIAGESCFSANAWWRRRTRTATRKGRLPQTDASP